MSNSSGVRHSARVHKGFDPQHIVQKTVGSPLGSNFLQFLLETQNPSNGTLKEREDTALKLINKLQKHKEDILANIETQNQIVRAFVVQKQIDRAKPHINLIAQYEQNLRQLDKQLVALHSNQLALTRTKAYNDSSKVLAIQSELLQHHSSQVDESAMGDLANDLNDAGDTIDNQGDVFETAMTPIQDAVEKDADEILERIVMEIHGTECDEIEKLEQMIPMLGERKSPLREQKQNKPPSAQRSRENEGQVDGNVMVRTRTFTTKRKRGGGGGSGGGDSGGHVEPEQKQINSSSVSLSSSPKREDSPLIRVDQSSSDNNSMESEFYELMAALPAIDGSRKPKTTTHHTETPSIPIPSQNIHPILPSIDEGSPINEDEILKRAQKMLRRQSKQKHKYNQRSPSPSSSSTSEIERDKEKYKKRKEDKLPKSNEVVNEKEDDGKEESEPKLQLTRKRDRDRGHRRTSYASAVAQKLEDDNSVDNEDLLDELLNTKLTKDDALRYNALYKLR